jgi:hypothetical protein
MLTKEKIKENWDALKPVNLDKYAIVIWQPVDQ